MPKITKRFIDTIRPDTGGKDKFLWDEGDGALKGFGIRVKPSGIASYFVQYRNKEGRTRRLVLGKITTLTPEEARIEAKKKLAVAEMGGDPSADRHAIRASITVSELCELYLKDAALRIKPSTLAVDRVRIDSHVKPLLGRHRVNSLTSADIERFQNDVAAGKTAKSRREKGRGGHAKGGRGAAVRTLEMLITILEFARRRKIIAENPARGIRKFERKKNRRFLSTGEITALGTAMLNMEADNAEKKRSNTAIAAIRALLLTGCRKSEILALPWEWLDAKASCIRFEDTKTGAQIRPIGETAAKFLSAQPKKKTEDGEEIGWIFPAGRGEGHLIGAPKIFERLCEKAEIKDASLHTLRHTFATVAAELGYSELTIAGMLGHTVPGVTARYAHIPDVALISAADRVSARIAALLAGEKEEAKVVPIKIAKHR